MFNVEFTASLDGCSGKITKTIRVYNKKVNTDVNTVTNLDVNMYPNPSDGFVYIESPDEITTVTIFDISGKKVSEVENINAKKAEINTGGLSPGVYVVTISTRSLYSINKKLIVR